MLELIRANNITPMHNKTLVIFTIQQRLFPFKSQYSGIFSLPRIFIRILVFQFNCNIRLISLGDKATQVF